MTHPTPADFHTDPKLPPSADRVILACRELNDAQKLVWIRIRDLDKGPERCRASDRTLAAQLAKPRGTVRRLRRELVQLGLLGQCAARPGARARRAGRNGAWWWPRLPADCVPPRTVKGERVIELAHRLDWHLREFIEAHGGSVRSKRSPKRTLSGGESLPDRGGPRAPLEQRDVHVGERFHEAEGRSHEPREGDRRPTIRPHRPDRIIQRSRDSVTDVELMTLVRQCLYGPNGREPVDWTAGRDITILGALRREYSGTDIQDSILGLPLLRDEGRLPGFLPGTKLTLQPLENPAVFTAARKAYYRSLTREPTRSP